MATNITCDKDVENLYCVSDEEYVDIINNYLNPNPWEVIVIIMYILVFIVGVIGNFLVCFVVLRNEYMRTVTNVFLVNLAIGDFLVINFCLPFTLVEDIRETWYFGPNICRLVKYIQHVSITVSVLTLVIISMERYMAVCSPLRFKATPRRAVFFIVIIWLAASAIGTFQVIINDTKRFKRLPANVTLLTSCGSRWDPSLQIKVKAFEFSILFVFPFLLVAVAYLMIGVTLWFTTLPGSTESQSMVLGKHKSSAVDNTLRGRRRAALMLIVIVIMFFVCYLPVHITHFIQIRGAGSSSEALAWNTFAVYSHWLCYFNSAINPVIYNFMSMKFRREFKRAMLCRQPRRRTYISTASGHYVGVRQLQAAHDHDKTEHCAFSLPAGRAPNGRQNAGPAGQCHPRSRSPQPQRLELQPLQERSQSADGITVASP